MSAGHLLHLNWLAEEAEEMQSDAQTVDCSVIGHKEALMEKVHTAVRYDLADHET